MPQSNSLPRPVQGAIDSVALILTAIPAGGSDRLLDLRDEALRPAEYEKAQALAGQMEAIEKQLEQLDAANFAHCREEYE